MKPIQTKPALRSKKQRGIMLIESLIAILIFSLGILAMVGMQARSISQTTQAKYRADAAFLANKIIAQMWSDAPANRLNYATGGVNFNIWKTQELDAYLPAGLASATVTVVQYTASPLLLVAPVPPPIIGHNVTVRIQWRSPTESPSAPPHTYVTTTDII
jgi:type IV pilus assembly protein PilV